MNSESERKIDMGGVEEEFAVEKKVKKTEREFDEERMIEYYTRKYKELTPQEIEEKVKFDLDKIEAEQKEFENNVKRLAVEAKQDPDKFKKDTERIDNFSRELSLLRTSGYDVGDILTGEISWKLSIRKTERIDALKEALLQIEAKKAEEVNKQG